jgi:hypothetical protein
MSAAAPTTGRGTAGPPNGAAAWHQRAAELARWLWDRYVIRTDVWGGYVALAERDKERTRADGTKYKLGPTCTRPAVSKRGLIALTASVLERHCRATRAEHVAGIHTTSPNNLCRFGMIETDWHGPESTGPEINWRATLTLYKRLRTLGFKPLLWDSNGKGGYHLDVLFRSPVPSRRLFWFLRDVVKDFKALGLPARPETFPKQSELRPREDGRGRYGNWCRLPGRHHTSNHWARVWDGSTFLEGADAVEYMLGLTGDDPELVPDDVAFRVRAYMAKLPHLAEGQGRDDVAYTFAAWLGRDMELAEPDVLRWLGEWDAGNCPPKGPERLREILANAHTYGQNGYGSARHTPPPTPPTPAPSAPPPLRTGLVIILDHFRETLQPRFKRGTAIFSDALSREVRPGEVCFAAGSPLLDKLKAAADAPLDKRHEVDVSALPKFFWTWCKSAWQDLLATLSEEETLEEQTVSAGDEFRGRVRAGLLRLVTLGFERSRKGRGDEDAEQRVERRSLIDWCRLLAKPMGWGDIRGHLIWCKRGPDGAPLVALRPEVFGQIGGDPDLARMTFRKFAQLAALYDVGERVRMDGNTARAVELKPSFVADLLAGPGPDDPGEAQPKDGGDRRSVFYRVRA